MKSPVLESFLDKVSDLEACNFIIKNRLQHSFPAKFDKFLGIPILKNICKRLLLSVVGLKLSRQKDTKRSSNFIFFFFFEFP